LYVYSPEVIGCEDADKVGDGRWPRSVSLFFLHAALVSRVQQVANGSQDRSKLTASAPIRERLAELLDAYVSGEAKSRLVLPYGQGSDPIWKRMRAPNATVVEFRTWDTRTFGFFCGPDIYVGVRMALTDELKKLQRDNQSDPYLPYAASVQTLISRIVPSEVEGDRDVEQLVTD
jgi:hypothetical protein